MLHIIINPASSSGRGLKKWEAIEKLFQEAGAEYTVHFVSEENNLDDICASLTSGSEECTLVILGGDGSMNGAVNGIRDFAHTKIGFIPLGSGNDLALDLGLPGDPAELVRRIVREEVIRECDIGRVTFHNRSSLLDPMTHKPVETDGDTASAGKAYRLFNISAGIGFDAACCQEAEVSPFKKVLNKVHLGKLIYLSAAIRLILTAPMKPAKITFRGTVPDQPVNSGEAANLNAGNKKFKESRIIRHMLFTVCMNRRFEGGGFRFCPDASDNDGFLDSCIAGDLHRLNFFRIFPTAYEGNHLRFKGVDSARSMSVTIQTKVPLWVHTDGEVFCKSTCITVDILPEKLKMIV